MSTTRAAIPAFLVLAAALPMAIAAAPKAPADPSAADPGRLERGVVPVFQAIRLDLDAGRPDYAGSVRIDLEVRERAASFRFHARDLELTRLELSGKRGAVAVTHAAGDGDLVTVTAAAPMERGTYTLAADFTNAFGTEGAGLYRTEVDGQGYLFTQFEATEARGAFPCFDEPSFKIPFETTLVVPEGHLAVANTAPARETVAAGRRTVVFRKTPPLPTYLLAIATGPLETVPIPGLRFPARVVTVRGQSGLAGEAVRLTPPIVRALEDWFGLPYPYDKLDLIAVPEFWAGGMENAGAVTFADGILLVDPRAPNPAHRRDLVATLAHEIAHMWFGDLVTMTWWDDLWLNESFASWMGSLISDRAFPDLRLGIEEVRSAQSALATDARLSTRAVRQPVPAGFNMLQLADELAYSKGEAVLGMFERFIGPEAFRRGVIAYLKAHRFGNATAADLFAALDRAAGREVAAAMSTFLDQPGVPIVRCDLLDGGRVRLRQRRFLASGQEAPPGLWQIPVTLKYAAGGKVATRSFLLREAEQVIDLGARPDWIHPNADERGYYRWELPADLMDVLAESAADVLDLRERLGLLGNLSALLDPGRIDGVRYLRALERFAGDPDPEVISGVVEEVRKIRLPLLSVAGRAAIAGYLRRVVGPSLERFGRERRPGEPESVSVLRSDLLEILGGVGRDGTILDDAARLAAAYRRDPASVDPAIAAAILRLSAIRGDRDLFEAYRAAFESAAVPRERSRCLYALGTFDDPGLAKQALAYALNGPLRDPEVLVIPGMLFEEDRHEERVWTWFTENYDAIMKRLPPDFRFSLAGFASGCSEERLAAARAFFADPAHRPPGIDAELAKVADGVRECAALRAREGAAVVRYLGGAPPGGGGSP